MFFSNIDVDRIINCSNAASDIIMDFYKSNFVVSKKLDDSPVTEADLAASKYLEGNLPMILDVPVLSEESYLTVNPSLEWDTYWLIDPIDGTRDFINKTKDFCICIALIHKNKSVFGLINACYDKEVWFAELGLGSYKVVSGEKYQVKTELLNNIIVTTGSKRLSPKLDELLSVFPGYDYYRRGSALKFIDIAEGKANIYPKLWDTCEWDTAAAQIILEESGGFVVDLNGNSLSYGRKKSLINPHFIAYLGINKRKVESLIDNIDSLES